MKYLKLVYALIGASILGLVLNAQSNTAAGQPPAAKPNTPDATHQSAPGHMVTVLVSDKDVAWNGGQFVNALRHPKALKPNEAITGFNMNPGGKSNYTVVDLSEQTAPDQLKALIAANRAKLSPGERDGVTFTIVGQKTASAPAASAAKPAGQ